MVENNVTTLIMVRHGEAEGNVNRLFHGNYDSSLTENGHAQAKVTAKYLENYKIDKIYSSDLKRTCSTAGYLSEKINIPIIKRADLREINGGEWENLDWKLLPEKYPKEYEDWLKYPHKLQMPKGESMAEVEKRAINAINEIIEENKGKTVCVFSHGTVIKVLMCYFKGIPLSRFVTEPWFDNASVTVVKCENSNFKIELEGYNKHLGELSTLNKQKWWRKDALAEGEDD